MKIVLLGHMGRDEALADRLKDHQLHIIGGWKNPGLVDKATASGGKFYQADSITNNKQIIDIVEHVRPAMFLTNFDDSLAAGIVDVLQERIKANKLGDIYIPCPNREAARIEWDKFFLRELIDEIEPSFNPLNFMAQDKASIDEAIAYFKDKNIEIAIKPRGLTGGKGVKVMGKHFETFDQAKEYALAVIADKKQAGVEIQEKIEGHEFTLQIFTDGKTIIEPPATYDYPYREDGDSGPGTGGMGAFSMEDGLLPFVSRADYKSAIDLMRQLLKNLKTRQIDYKGVLYPTFFKTRAGLKIVETNARGGDPELINIIDLIEEKVDLAEVLRLLATGDLKPDSIKYKKLGSAMTYLVSPDYGYRSGAGREFRLDTELIESLGCKIRFAAAERIKDNLYRSVGSSRVVGIAATGKTAQAAGNKVRRAIETGFGRPLGLSYRREIASASYIDSLDLT